MKMRRSLARCLGAATGLSLATLTGAAAAHGGIPRAFEIITEPGNPDDVLLRSDIWGFFRTTDGGQTWQWTCAEAYGASSMATNHQNMVIAPGGRLLVANEFKGLRVTDDLCTWKEIADLKGELVVDVALVPGGVVAVTSTNDGQAVVGQVWKSTDNGDHFVRVGDTLPATFGAQDIAFAPSDPQRVYVTGHRLESTESVFVRSNDGGKTWAETHSGSLTGAYGTLRVAAVHPTRPDVVFLWADNIEDLGQDSPDAIYATGDGGTTWTPVFSSPGDLPGFALSDEGNSALVAGPLAGVRAAKLLFVDTAPFLRISQFGAGSLSEGKAWGLRVDGELLYAGRDNFTAAGVPAFTYGVSNDHGLSFTERMNICEVKYSSCGHDTSVGRACDSAYGGPGGFEEDFLKGPRCGGGASGVGGGGTGAASGTAGTSGRAGGSGTAGSGGTGPAAGAAGGAGGASGSNGTSGGPDGGVSAPPEDLRINSGCDVTPARAGRDGFWGLLAALGLLVSVRRRRT